MLFQFPGVLLLRRIILVIVQGGSFLKCVYIQQSVLKSRLYSYHWVPLSFVTKD